MALYQLKRIEAGAINPAITEAGVQVQMVDRETGLITTAIVQAAFVDGSLDVIPTLQALTDAGFFPNDWGGTPTP